MSILKNYDYICNLNKGYQIILFFKKISLSSIKTVSFTNKKNKIEISSNHCDTLFKNRDIFEILKRFRMSE